MTREERELIPLVAGALLVLGVLVAFIMREAGARSKAEIEASTYAELRGWRCKSPKIDAAIDRAGADGRISNDEMPAIANTIATHSLKVERDRLLGHAGTEPVSCRYPQTQEG